MRRSADPPEDAPRPEPVPAPERADDALPLEWVGRDVRKAPRP